MLLTMSSVLVFFGGDVNFCILWPKKKWRCEQYKCLVCFVNFGLNFHISWQKEMEVLRVYRTFLLGKICSSYHIKRKKFLKASFQISAKGVTMFRLYVVTCLQSIGGILHFSTILSNRLTCSEIWLSPAFMECFNMWLKIWYQVQNLVVLPYMKIWYKGPRKEEKKRKTGFNWWLKTWYKWPKAFYKLPFDESWLSNFDAQLWHLISWTAAQCLPL